MTKLAVTALLGLASSCISPVMTFGGGKSTQEAQHDTLTKVTPPALVVKAEWAGTVTVARMRVWADDEYRAQNVHWQQSFQDELDYANDHWRKNFVNQHRFNVTLKG